MRSVPPTPLAMGREGAASGSGDAASTPAGEARGAGTLSCSGGRCCSVGGEPDERSGYGAGDERRQPGDKDEEGGTMARGSNASDDASSGTTDESGGGAVHDPDEAGGARHGGGDGSEGGDGDVAQVSWGALLDARHGEE